MSVDISHSRIVIVDDEPANIDLLTGLLETLGFEHITGEADSRRAIRRIQDIQPDLLLLDLNMPHLTGFDILDQLDERGWLVGSMLVMVLTADTTRETRERALAGGASDFLTKPFDLTEAGLRIRNLLLLSNLLGQMSRQNEHLEIRVQERTQQYLMERLRAEEKAEQMRTLYDAVKEQNDTLRKISWTQSHIVRAPLARILSVINLYRTGDVDGLDDQQMIQIIEDSARELDVIIGNIVDTTHQANISPSQPASSGPDEA